MLNNNVSIVIITYNRCEDLKQCLDSLMRQTFKGFETIIIDNGSTDSTINLLKKYSVKTLVNTTKKLSYLFNLAWQSASGDYIGYLADDVELHPDWLKNAMDTFETFENAGAVSGPIISTKKQEMRLLYERTEESKLLAFLAKIYDKIVMEGKLFKPGALASSGAYSMGAGLESSCKIKSPIIVDLLTTSAMVMKREVFLKVGNFDENFYFNHADGDFFIRMKKAGYELIFNPKAIAWHRVRHGPSRDPYYVARDTGYFLAKNIHPKNFSEWLRFILNIMYFNAYWFHKAYATKDLKQIKGISAFTSGFLECLMKN